MESSEIITARFGDLVGYGVEFEQGMKDMCAVASDVQLDVDVRGYSYQYPEKFKIIKGLSVRDYQVVDHCEYYICLSGSDKEELCRKMESIAIDGGANACVAYVERRESIIEGNENLTVFHISAQPVVLARHIYCGEPLSVEDDEDSETLTEVFKSNYQRAKKVRLLRLLSLVTLLVLMLGLFSVSSVSADLGITSSVLLFGWEEVVSLSILAKLYIWVYLKHPNFSYSPYRYESSIAKVKGALVPLLPPLFILLAQVYGSISLLTV
ncbi:hypothetical protein F7U66_00025 [Vibrio parahaemolyticus]|nr:hypothetical protein [Vibrio parahaemolyticus]